MEKAEALHRLKFLYDQVHQTEERIEHLPAAMPLHVHPRSVNWDEDKLRIEGEYNRLVQSGIAQGLFTEGELQAAELPLQFRDDQY